MRPLDVGRWEGPGVGWWPWGRPDGLLRDRGRWRERKNKAGGKAKLVSASAAILSGLNFTLALKI